jgi:AAA+ superfamily predicted ATPase
MGKFVLKKSIKYGKDDITELVESDFAHLVGDTFHQYEYLEDAIDNRVIVKPGIWSIFSQDYELKIKEAAFVEDRILETFLSTKDVSDRIARFFSKLAVYKKHGIEIPKRGALLYGPAGTGKTTIISKVARDHLDGKTAVIIWHSDRFRPGDVKELFKNFKYEDVERQILVVEDMGGVEVDQVRAESDSSLLSLLDNQEKAFTIPTYIIATTNYPEIFMGNLTNRPGRFDDKIEVGYPPAEARLELFKFYTEETASDEQLDMIMKSKFEKFTPAHIREVVIRSEIWDQTLEQSMLQILEEIQLYEKAFEKKRKSMSIIDE